MRVQSFIFCDKYFLLSTFFSFQWYFHLNSQTQLNHQLSSHASDIFLYTKYLNRYLPTVETLDSIP